MTQSYEHCAKALLRERQLSRMPPFNHLCLLRIESSVLQQGVRFARHCFETAFRLQQLVQQIELIGPLPAPMEKKAGRFRFQLHIKALRAPGCSAFSQALAVTIEAARPPLRFAGHWMSTRRICCEAPSMRPGQAIFASGPAEATDKSVGWPGHGQ